MRIQPGRDDDDLVVDPEPTLPSSSEPERVGQDRFEPSYRSGGVWRQDNIYGEEYVESAIQGLG